MIHQPHLQLIVDQAAEHLAEAAMVFNCTCLHAHQVWDWYACCQTVYADMNLNIHMRAAGATISRVNAADTAGSMCYGAVDRVNDQQNEDGPTSDLLRLRASKCDACKNPVLYAYGSPEIFVGVAQGCYPRGTQLKEGNSFVNYWTDGKPLSKSCQDYFMLIQHSDISVEMFDALQKAGVITEGGELPNQDLLSHGESASWNNSIHREQPACKTKKRVHPWPIAGAPRLTTNSSRIKGMGSGINLVSTSSYGAGVHDKTGHCSQYLPHPAHITTEEPLLDVWGYPIIPPTTRSELDQLQSAAKAKVVGSKTVARCHSEALSVSKESADFRISPYGAVLTRRALVSQNSPRRTPRTRIEQNRPPVSAPSGMARPRAFLTDDLESGQTAHPYSAFKIGRSNSSPTNCAIYESESVQDPNVSGAAVRGSVMFDDGKAPQLPVADRISVETLQVLNASRSKVPGGISKIEQTAESCNSSNVEVIIIISYVLPASVCVSAFVKSTDASS